VIYIQEIYNNKQGVWEYKYKIKEIGLLWDVGDKTKFIAIYEEEFLNKLFKTIEKIDEEYFDYSMLTLKDKNVYGAKTRIICPICEKGTITLVKKKKNFCKTHGNETSTQYLFYCSRFIEGCPTALHHNRTKFNC